jgi:ABC-type amino acid transport substrate-binding protein
MLVALVTTSSLTAGLASAFTVLQLDSASIRDAAELRGQRVAVVRDTTAAEFATRQGVVLSAQPDFEAALRAIERGEVVAVVHDRSMLQYYLAQNPS